MNKMFVVIVGEKQFEENTICELVSALEREQKLLDRNMCDAIRAEIIDNIEHNFIGTPAQCRQAFADVDRLTELKFMSADTIAARNARYDELSNAITDLIFKASGLVNRKAFNIIDQYAFEAASSDAERLGMVVELSDLFRDVAAANI